MSISPSWLPDLAQAFCYIVHDAQRSKLYRALAGGAELWVRHEATFTNFRNRLGEARYLEIFHTSPNRHLLLLSPITRISPIFVQFAKSATTESQIDILAFTVTRPRSAFHPQFQQPQDRRRRGSTHPRGPNPKLSKIQCPREPHRIFEQHIAVSLLFFEPSNSFFFRCPKLSRDTPARIGVRRDPRNPDRKEKIFGYNAIMATSIEPQLAIELPFACITIAGNTEEGNQFIPLHDQIRRCHSPSTLLHLADAKYDELHNYQCARDHQAIPLIDYNPRSENLSHEAVLARGYNPHRPARRSLPQKPYPSQRI